MYVFAILWPKLVRLCMCVLCVIGGQGKEGGMKELKRYKLTSKVCTYICEACRNDSGTVCGLSVLAACYQ